MSLQILENLVMCNYPQNTSQHYIPSNHHSYKKEKRCLDFESKTDLKFINLDIKLFEDH